ncbi:MAG: hypothetical protein K6T75_02280 [Acetobacteraceae bacterium]|nr:hypothetical protein [Acetobacteraceae bacterium]
MLNLVWLALVLGGMAFAAVRGDVGRVADAAMSSATTGVDTALGLMGVMCLWLGLMKVAEKSGFVAVLARALTPLGRLLFPGLPKNSPALGPVFMNMGANLLGLGNAATPFGLKAMQELQKLNPHPDTATDEMCSFLVLNTSSITLVAAVVVALRAQAGARQPADIVVPTFLATCCACAVGLTVERLLRRLFPAEGGRRAGGRLREGREGPAGGRGIGGAAGWRGSRGGGPR